MTPSDKEALARVGRDSAEHIRRATDSNLQSAEHVRQSKAAIARSFELLKRPFHK